MVVVATGGCRRLGPVSYECKGFTISLLNIDAQNYDMHGIVTNLCISIAIGEWTDGIKMFRPTGHFDRVFFPDVSTYFYQAVHIAPKSLIFMRI